MAETEGAEAEGVEATGKKGGKCPVCSKPVEPTYRPFCSKRCQQLDLGRWLNENYRIASENDPASADGSAGGDAEE